MPRTWLRDGPLAEAMVQLWQETDPEQGAVDLVPLDEVPVTCWKLVGEGEDRAAQVVALIHEDTAALRRMAVYDVIFNKRRPKATTSLPCPAGTGTVQTMGHVPCGAQAAVRAVELDREASSPEGLSGIDRVLAGLEGEMGLQLDELLAAEEIGALPAHCTRLHSTAAFPGPADGMPAVPRTLF